MGSNIYTCISGICAWTQQIIKIFIIEQVQQKSMTKFFFKLKKPYFGPLPPNFRDKKILQKIWLWHAQLDKGFYQHATKFRKNLMI